MTSGLKDMGSRCRRESDGPGAMPGLRVGVQAAPAEIEALALAWSNGVADVAMICQPESHSIFDAENHEALATPEAC